MSNYTKTTDFDVKDSLPSGDTGKIIRGSEFEVEFENIEVAIASKADSLNTVLTGNTSVTNLSVTGNTTLGNAASDTVTVNADFSSDLLPSADATYDLGAPGSEWQDLYVTGTANIDSLVADTVAISGGTVTATLTGNVTGNVTGNLTGTVLTAAQPNITSVGTLTSASISGDLAVDTNTLFVDVSTGNVGIGVTSPTAKLHVAGTIQSQSGSSVAQMYSDGSAAYFTSVGAFPSIFSTNGIERLRITSSGNVGIGTSAPLAKGHIAYTLEPTANRAYGLIVNGNATGANGDSASILLNGTNTTARGASIAAEKQSAANDHDLIFSTSAASATPTERMRIDSSGNLLVGTEAAASSSSAGSITVRSNGIKMFLGGGIVARENATGLVFSATAVLPFFNTTSVDNTVDLGSASFRFDDIFATNGTIQTSDRNEKQDIEELSEAEQRVAVACKGLLRKFRWKSAVEEKGDDARIHFGIIAQDLQAAFEAEGLDAGRYAMFISSTWTDEETGEERTRLGVRYSELLAFIIAAI